MPYKLLYRFTDDMGFGVYNSAEGFMSLFKGVNQEYYARNRAKRPPPGLDPGLDERMLMGWPDDYLFGFGSIACAKRWFDRPQDMTKLAKNGARLRVFLRSDTIDQQHGNTQSVFLLECKRFADFPADALYTMSEQALNRAARAQLKAKPCYP